VVLNFDGSRLLTACGDLVRMWNVATGEPLALAHRSSGAAWPDCFSPDSRWVALANESGTAVQIWEANMGEPITPVFKHAAPVSRIQFSSDSRLLLIADYEKALDLAAYPICPWRKPALAWLAARQPDRYQSFCARLLKANNRRDMDANPQDWAWGFALGPNAVADLAPVVKHTETWLKGSPMAPERLLCMGAVLHRAGRFAEAEHMLQEAIRSAERKDAPLALLFLAMAQHQRKQADKARASLTQALQLLEQPMPRQAETGASWPDRLTCQMLCREAEALIDGKMP
jgi:tetratricopeptide (TPR) repeat protein